MMRRLRTGGFAFDFVGRARLWFAISGIVILVSIGSLAVRELNLGLEFRGGTAFQFQAERDVSVSEVRDVMAEVGVDSAVVQEVGRGGFLVQSAHLERDVQEAALDRLTTLAGIDSRAVNITDVGPKWGRQITNKAVQALVFFLLVALAYISIRLEPKMAVAAMVAVFHDLIITAGIYSLSGFVVTPATVIAILTILGYSLYDTVVIFDRVKDRTGQLSAAGRITYSGAANESLNRVLVRSLNTSITSLLPVGSLLFIGSFLLGAETLRELALALFIGLAAGTYSSIFVATPVLALWKEREDRWATLRTRIAARTGEPTAPPRPTEVADAEEEEPAQVPSGPGGARRPPSRPPKRRKKKKRR